MFLRALAVFAGLTLAVGIATQDAHGVPFVSSTFDSNSEGWAFVNDGTNLTFHPTGGNPGGYISVTDLQLGDVWYFSAPAKFLGNQSAASHGTLKYDLSQISGIGTTQFATAADVIIAGAGLQLVFNAGANPAQYPTWSSYSVPFDAAAGWRLFQGGVIGANATQAQLDGVLAALTGLFIEGEFTTGADTGNLDNVSLEVAPEPTTLLLLGSTFAGFGLARWRRRRH